MRSRFAVLGAVLSAGIALAQTTAPPAAFFEKTEAMVPMRDGVKLQTVIFAPRAAPASLPILFDRTPYGVPDEENAVRARYAQLIEDGYIFVFQNIRGRFKSEGQFVMQRPPRDPKDAKTVDESSDAYDTIEWLLQNVKGHNGRVGMFGISYPGWLTTMALLDPHPR